MIVTFCIIMAFSVLAAAMARRGQARMNIGQFLTAGRSLPSLMVFFLTLGETISLSAMTAFPGGIFARGASYGYWYLGFVVLGL